jgi:hypothetical protein
MRFLTNYWKQQLWVSLWCAVLAQSTVAVRAIEHLKRVAMRGGVALVVTIARISCLILLWRQFL